MKGKMGDKVFQEKTKLHLAKLKKEGTNFEVSIDPDRALMFKEGKLDDVSQALLVEGIFFECSKGLHASEERLKAIFGTTDVYEIASRIIKEGEIQSTLEHRAAEREEKRKKIIGIIHANAIDPRTKAPHPPARVEAAIEQAKVRIDEKKSAEEQIDDIIKALRPILPIKFEKKELEIHLLAEHASKGYGNLKLQSKILHETWNNDGSWTGIVEIPGGLYDEFCDMLNKLTHGRVEIKVVETR